MQHPYFCTEIAPATFEQHLKYLAENGYTAKTLSEFADMNNRAGHKNVVITFDDGYQDFYNYALPLLNRYKMPATVFVPAGLIDKGRCELEGKRLMSWEQIRECSNQGIEIGSHSNTHTLLVNIDRNDLAHELSESKKEIENQLGHQINSFAYPYRFPEENRPFVNLLCSLLEKNGYTFGVTTRIGTAKPGHNPLQLKRLPVNEFDDTALFRAKLDGAYDWVYTLQYSIKVIRSKLMRTI